MINGVEVQLPSKERVETFILDYQCLLDNEFHSTYFNSVAKNEMELLTAVFSRLLDRFLFEDGSVRGCYHQLLSGEEEHPDGYVLSHCLPNHLPSELVALFDYKRKMDEFIMKQMLMLPLF